MKSPYLQAMVHGLHIRLFTPYLSLSNRIICNVISTETRHIPLKISFEYLSVFVTLKLCELRKRLRKRQHVIRTI